MDEFTLCTATFIPHGLARTEQKTALCEAGMREEDNVGFVKAQAKLMVQRIDATIDKAVYYFERKSRCYSKEI